jgi:hypothetical protein
MILLDSTINNPTAINIIIMAIFSIFGVLLGIIGHFLRQVSNNLKEVSTGIVTLQIAFSKEQAISEQNRIASAKRDSVIDGRLEYYGKKLDSHEMKITVIEHRLDNE